jgi:erythromycin esterase-like protein
LIDLDQPKLCLRVQNVDIGRDHQREQRIAEALAQVDAQREKLTGQLGELEAAERVLARALQQRPAVKKDRHSQDADRRDEGGCCTATKAPAH